MARVPGMYGHIKLIAGTACPELSEEIADYLTDKSRREEDRDCDCQVGEICEECQVTLLERVILKFANDNTFVSLGESVRGQDVYIIQSMYRPVNDNLMELLITLDAVRRDSAGRITAVMPYMGYARTDKKDHPRTPITGRLVADMIQVAGADRYMAVDLHAGQIQGFFSIPGDALTAFHILKNYVRANVPLYNTTVVTVDLGFAKGGRNWAHGLGVPLAFVEKKRTDVRAKTLSLVGEVKGRNILLVDDEVDTAGSLCNAVELLDARGAQEITAVFTHPVFSPPAFERLAGIQDRIQKFIFTNTIPVGGEKLLPNMVVCSIADLLGEVIYRAHKGVSVGELFNE